MPHPIVHLKLLGWQLTWYQKPSCTDSGNGFRPLMKGEHGHSVPYLERRSGRRGLYSVEKHFGSWLQWTTVGESPDMHGTIKGLQPGMRHLCRVRAYNENGWGAFSEVVVLDTPPWNEALSYQNQLSLWKSSMIMKTQIPTRIRGLKLCS